MRSVACLPNGDDVQVEWLQEAADSLEGIIAYWADQNAAAALRIGELIADMADRLADFSFAGRLGRVAGTRELVVPGTPYVVPYRPRGDRLEVIAVFHGRQKWPKRL